MAVPSCTTSAFMSASLSLFASACFLFASAILLKVRKGKQSKGKERDGMRSSVFSMLYVLLGTCLCNVLVQIMKEVFNHHSTPHYTPEPGNADTDNDNTIPSE